MKREQVIASLKESWRLSSPRADAYPAGRKSRLASAPRLEAMDGMKAEIARLFRAKEKRRWTLSQLPYPEKVRAVIKLQEMAAPILRARGGMVRPWASQAISDGNQSAPAALREKTR